MPTNRSEAADETLMARYQRGDPHAFAELVRRHQTPVYNFIRYQLHDRGVAEQLTEEVLLRVAQEAESYRHETLFSTWLYRIAREVCARFECSLPQPPLAPTGSPTLPQVRAGPTEQRESDPVLQPTADRSDPKGELTARILDGLVLLPEEQREVLLLREIARLPFGEIALVVGVEEDVVRSRLRSALERLQEAVSGSEEYARALR